MSKYSVRVKINKKINNAPIGSLVTIPTDEQGTPFDPFWRRIFKDSKIDQCVEILHEKHIIKTNYPESKDVEGKKKVKPKKMASENKE